MRYSVDVNAIQVLVTDDETNDAQTTRISCSRPAICYRPGQVPGQNWEFPACAALPRTFFSTCRKKHAEILEPQGMAGLQLTQ